jgi:hypothetical protein
MTQINNLKDLLKHFDRGHFWQSHQAAIRSALENVGGDFEKLKATPLTEWLRFRQCGKRFAERISELGFARDRFMRQKEKEHRKPFASGI